MKVVILGTRGFPNVQGGVEKHCEGLAVNLVNLECEVIVFTRKPYIDENIKEFKGVKLVTLPTIKHKYLEAFCHTFIGIFAALRYKPDILHIQAIGPGLFTPLARILGMNVVLTSHGSNYKHLKWGRLAKVVLKIGEFLGVKFANRVIAISKPIADDIKRKYKKEAVVIPNGITITPPLESDAFIRKYGLQKGKYILAVGRFVPEKGFDGLIKSFIRFQDLGSKSQGNKDASFVQESEASGRPSSLGVKLVIVGDADHPDKYSLNLKKKASGFDNIILTGFLKGKPLEELYSHAGLFVLPSYYEGLPIVLLEAMSYSLNCIASDISANREIGLSEDRYFKAGDVEALAERIREFIDRPLTEEKKRKQVDMIRQRYDWEKIAEKTLQVYKLVLGS